MMRFLVTGANGDIAEAVAKVLKKNLGFVIKNSSKWISEYSKIISSHQKISIRANGYTTMKCENNISIILKTLEDSSVYWQKFRKNFEGKTFAGRRCQKSIL